MNNKLYYGPKAGTKFVNSTKFIIRDTESDYWYRIYKNGRIQKLKSKWDNEFFTKLIDENTLIPISETQAMSTFTVAAKPIIPDDWEFAEESPRRPNVGDYFVATKDNKIVCCDNHYYTPIGCDNRRYIVKKKEAIMTKHIPFSGPGQYKLVNGQIVNLNKSAACLASDGVKNAYHTIESWHWRSDGMISGLGFPLGDNSLFLAEKISPTQEEQYYLFTDKAASYYGSQRYVVKRDSSWFLYYSHISKEHVDKSSEEFFQREIKNGSFEPCTKEEALAATERIPFRGPGQYRLNSGMIEDIGADMIGGKSGRVYSKSGMVKDISRLYIVEKLEVSPTNVVKETPILPLGIEESKYYVPEKSAVSKFDYWVAQPAKNFADIGRHIIFAAVISSIIYGAVNPVKVVSVIKSCLPKINVEWK